ncbi:MAG: ABC transporter permease [Clostridiales bacterium]|nr:ABC transporter permease [Clostridiales bacterium]
MDNILSLFVLGLSFGLTYFLLATGLTLTMGLMRVVNMSHGALYMIAGYLGVAVYTQTNNWMLAVVSGAALAGLLGLLLEVVFLRRLYEQPANQVLLTIGFINIINNIAQWIWGGFPKIAPVPESLSGAIQVGSVTIPVFRFIIIGFGILMAVLLWLLQDRTKIGAMVRAGMDNKEVAGTLGLNNKFLFTAVFVLGSLVAGLSSMVGGQLTGINMATGWDVLLASIIVVVVGGTGSIQGALLGGVIIGLVNTFGAAYFPNFASFIIYAVLIIILLIRPAGLLGRKMSVDRAVEDNMSKTGGKVRKPFWLEKSEDSPLLKSGWKLMAFKAAPYLFALLLLICVPPFIGTYMQGMMTRVLIFALFAISLDIVMGYTGMRSFGHAAFFGMGGYAVGILAVRYSIESFWLVLPITIILCALLSAIIGYFTLRVSGVHFLLVTMAFGQLLYVVATKWYAFTGGTDGLIGIPRPNLGFAINWTSGKIYYFVLIVFIICYYLIYRFMRSSYGRALLGVKENEGRMRSLGYNTWLLKYMGVILAGVFAGVAGLLFAYTYQAMVPNNFALETSALPMLMVIMGGAATLWGPALGAVVMVLVQNFAGIYMPDRWPLILGILYVVCVMFLRGGFARYLTNAWYGFGSRIFSGSKAPEPVAGKESEEDLKS